MTIARSEVLVRARAVALRSIPYNQATIAGVTGRRADCSGWVSYCWDLPTAGDGTWLRAYSTESLARLRLIRQISRAELRPGDAIGYCGPGSANGGGGHIALYVGADGDRVHVLDHGSGMGPKDRWVTWSSSSTGWLAPGKCKAWRYAGIVDEEDLVNVLVQRKGTEPVYVANGVTRRWVRSVGELADVRHLHASGQLPLAQGGAVQLVDDLDAYGLLIGPDPEAPDAPELPVDADTDPVLEVLAGIRQDLAVLVAGARASAAAMGGQ